MTLTNINFTPKNMLVRSALLLYKKKTSGTEVRRTLDVKLRFVSFIRFVGFNSGHGQFLRFVVVMVQSYLFSDLDLVK